ncbi:protein-disulfide isomerase [Rhodobacteraceae bacterium MBR-64]|jgi:protein-disulfide isomerase
MMMKLLPTTLAAVVVAGGAWWYSADTPMPTQTIATPVQAGFGAAQAQDVSGADLSLVKEMTLGQPDAPVEVIEYASFTCPHCADFSKEVFGKIKENYIDTGKVRFTMREVYFDRYGLWAGMVARCGGGEARYFGIVDVLFETQRAWLGPQEPTGIVQNLRGIGREAGLSDAQLDTCLNDADTAQALVAAYQQNATADDVRGTPTFIINGKKYSNMSYADFSSTLDGLLSN